MNDKNAAGLDTYQRVRRLVIGLLIILIMTVLLFGQSTYPPESATHDTIESIGLIIIFLGIVGRLWSTLYIGGRKSGEVVSGGPYSITRNPLYVFSSVCAIGVGAQMGSIVMALVFGALCAVAFHVVILREERFLEASFGEAFRTYKARVPRFFPNPSLYREGETGAFKPKLLLTTLLDGLLFIVAMPIFELIEVAQIEGTLPVLFRLP